MLDLFIDVMRYKVPYTMTSQTGLTVHSGFLRQYIELRSRILDHISMRQYEHVVISGHSLGGALATLCAVDVAHNISTASVNAYTFNAPRVGNARFVTSVDAIKTCSITRVVTEFDFIHHWPYIGFHHTSQCYVVMKRPMRWYERFFLRKNHSISTINELICGAYTHTTDIFIHLSQSCTP